MKTINRKDFLHQYGREMEEKGYEYLNSIFGSVKLAVSLGKEISNVEYEEYSDGPWDFEKLSVNFFGFTLTILHKAVNTMEAGRYSATEICYQEDSCPFVETFPNMGSLQKFIADKFTPKS